jgi:hypothetical protein
MSDEDGSPYPAEIYAGKVNFFPFQTKTKKRFYRIFSRLLANIYFMTSLKNLLIIKILFLPFVI